MRPFALTFALLAALMFASCSRDPNVVKQRYLENGNKYFGKGKYKEAAIMYKNALQKDLRFGPAHYHLGLASLKLQQWQQALMSLRRAHELIPESQPDHWDAAIKLSELYLVGTRERVYMDEVDAITKKLLARDPKSFDGHRLTADLAFSRATQAYSTGKRDDGAEYLKTAVEHYLQADVVKPGQPAVEMQLARCYIGQNRFPDAERLYKQALSRDKTFQAAYGELYKLYLLENKLSEGEQLLKDASANNPKQWGFLTLLAAHYYSQKRRDDMVGVLNQIKSHAKDFDQAYLTVGDFYLRMGDSDEALKQYREGLTADPKQKSTYQKRLIEVLMRQGKRSDAAEVASSILKDTPTDADARGLQASFMLDKGDVTRALVELQSVVNRNPDNPVARFQLGRAHQARNEIEQARQQFQKAIDLRPDYLMARLAMGSLQLQGRQFDGALKTVNEILAQDKDNVSARVIQSQALMGLSRFDDSKELLNALLKANPSSPTVLMNVGAVNLAQGKYREAEDAFRKAYQLDPANSRGLMGVVLTYIEENRSDAALELLRGEVEKNPNKVELRLNLANTAVRTGRYDMGISEFQKALGQLDKGSKASGDVYLRIGETYRRKGDLSNAVANLQKSREVLPDNPVVLGTLGLALDAAGRRQEARQAYEQTIKLEPNNGVALNNLAYLLAESDADLDQALTYAQKAKQTLPNMYEVSDTLGWIYLKKNLSDNAIEIFKELVAKQPNHATYRYHLGMALSQKGDRPNALKELKRALETNPPKDDKDKIQALISKLG